MKKFLAAVLTAAVILSTAACGSKEPESKELNVFMLSPDTYASGFISSYSGAGGDMTVNVDAGFTDPSMEVGDVLKKLNTKLMSDDGPDLIIMDGITPEGYVESGQLADLSEVIKESGDLLPIFSRHEGEIYYTPLAVGLIANASSSETDIAEDFFDIGEYVELLEENGLKSGTFNDNAVILYKTCIEPEILKEGKISETKLRDFFENIKRLLYCSKEQEGRVIGGVNPADYFPDGSSGFIDVCKKSADINNFYITSLSDFQEIYTLKRKGTVRLTYAEAGGGTAYMPNCMIAVNKNSKNKAAAMEMVKYLLSEDGQRDAADSGDYIPVNKGILKEKLENAQEVQASLNGLSVTLTPYTEDEITEITALMDSLKYEIKSDAYLMEIVVMTAQDYANGRLSMESALENAMSKIKIYMAE